MHRYNISNKIAISHTYDITMAIMLGSMRIEQWLYYSDKKDTVILI